MPVGGLAGSLETGLIFDRSVCLPRVTRFLILIMNTIYKYEVNLKDFRIYLSAIKHWFVKSISSSHQAETLS